MWLCDHHLMAIGEPSDQGSGCDNGCNGVSPRDHSNGQGSGGRGMRTGGGKSCWKKMAEKAVAEAEEMIGISRSR